MRQVRRRDGGEACQAASVSEGARILIMDSDHNCALYVAAVSATVWHANYLLNTRKVDRGVGRECDRGERSK